MRCVFFCSCVWVVWVIAADCRPMQQSSVSLLMEDVLNSGREAEPVGLHGNRDDLPHDGKQAKEEEKRTSVSDLADSSAPPQDPIRVQSVLRGFLLLMKQLQVFKESWARRRLGVEMFSTASLYQQFVKIYRYWNNNRNSEDFITLIINIRCPPVSVIHNQTYKVIFYP